MFGPWLNVFGFRISDLGPRDFDDVRENHDMGSFCRAGQKRLVLLPRHGPEQTDLTLAADCLRPKHRTLLGRQVFWLTAPDGFRTTFPPSATQPSAVARGAGFASPRLRFGGLADHSGGPATASHRFPFCPLVVLRSGDLSTPKEPVKITEEYRNRSRERRVRLIRFSRLKIE